MRFANGPRGLSPAAGFVAGDPLSRTRPGPVDEDIFTVVTTGSVMPSIVGLSSSYEPFSPAVISSSILIEGSVSKGRGYERKKLNSILLAQPVTSIGRTPFPSPTVMDVGLTGTFESPSWTHNSVGFNQAFVGTALSSSNYQNLIFNTFTSGTEPLEVTAVPASATLYYSKASTLRTVIAKHTASALDLTVQVTGTTPTSFAANTGTLCSLVTGSGLVGSGGNPAPFCASTNNPASFFISVPVSGRLVDIKVWVELAHISASAGTYDPLAMLGVSLKSPNITWGHAHPIYNDQLFQQQALSDHFSASIPNFYRDTFLLWEGPALSPIGGDQRQITNGAIYPSTADHGASDPLTGGFNRQKYPCWNLDRGMRTVFSDGAQVPNPRHLYSPTSPSGNFIGSPNASFGINSAYGNDCPWTSDATIPPGTQSRQAAGSPPPGWLTGPGGSANVNEWPTTGVNYGASTIRPVYPLLDPIFIKKVIGTEVTFMSSSVYSNQPTPDQWRGFRPGLRGTEISGTWTLYIVNNFNAGSFAQGDAMDLYFRQFRLEITYETPISSRVVTRRSFLSSAPRAANQPVYLYSISGTAKSNFGTLSGSAPDYFKTQVYVTSPGTGEIGRTFGVVVNSGSLTKIGLDPSEANYALLYRLSGSLAGISGSAPGWLFTGQGGMPIIPESSATLVPFVAEPIRTVPFTNFMQPRRDLDIPSRLADVAFDANPQVRLRDLAVEFVSASAT